VFQRRQDGTGGFYRDKPALVKCQRNSGFDQRNPCRVGRTNETPPLSVGPTNPCRVAVGPAKPLPCR
ncbi:hypothetical protein LSAT2_009353, partial [Lamellibrachia satsuma]